MAKMEINDQLDAPPEFLQVIDDCFDQLVKFSSDSRVEDNKEESK